MDIKSLIDNIINKFKKYKKIDYKTEILLRSLVFLSLKKQFETSQPSEVKKLDTDKRIIYNTNILKELVEKYNQALNPKQKSELQNQIKIITSIIEEDVNKIGIPKIELIEEVLPTLENFKEAMGMNELTLINRVVRKIYSIPNKELVVVKVEKDERYKKPHSKVKIFTRDLVFPNVIKLNYVYEVPFQSLDSYFIQDLLDEDYNVYYDGKLLDFEETPNVSYYAGSDLGSLPSDDEDLVEEFPEYVIVNTVPMIETEDDVLEDTPWTQRDENTVVVEKPKTPEKSRTPSPVQEDNPMAKVNAFSKMILGFVQRDYGSRYERRGGQEEVKEEVRPVEFNVPREARDEERRIAQLHREEQARLAEIERERSRTSSRTTSPVDQYTQFMANLEGEEEDEVDDEEVANLWGFGINKKSIIQSVIFDKNKWDVRSSKKWLKENNFISPKVDKKDNFLRFRQKDPDELKSKGYKKYITKKIKNGIELIISYK